MRKRLEDLLLEWRRGGLPSRSKLLSMLQAELYWKVTTGASGLWESPPLMLTATLDDGWGHGLELIEVCGKAAGMQILSLGLLQKPEKIVSTCHDLQPEVLGLTMLQFDSEPHLIYISENLPPKTRLIAGGPLFRIDPEMSARIGAHLAARNVADFLEFILTIQA